MAITASSRTHSSLVFSCIPVSKTKMSSRCKSGVTNNCLYCLLYAIPSSYSWTSHILKPSSISICVRKTIFIKHIHVTTTCCSQNSCVTWVCNASNEIKSPRSIKSNIISIYSSGSTCTDIFRNISSTCSYACNNCASCVC